MAISFNGVTKLIILSTGTTYVSVVDIYSSWKEWVLLDNNAHFLPAISYIGADPIPGGQLGSTFFLENGWKIRPYEGNHTLTIAGNLYSRDGSDTVTNTLGAWNVRIISVVSTLVETVSVGGIGTVQEVKEAVWGATNLASYGAGSAGEKINAVGASADPWNAELINYTTDGTTGKKLNDLINGPSVEQIADQVRTELTPELTHILTLESNPGLTPTQATMLLELYNIMGLDPTKPLVVTNTSREAGTIIQSIDTNDERTILNRV